MATQRELANQMLAQLRILDPDVSAEIGTPERKIIDTVAQGIAESQIDITVLNGALDMSAKFGSDLDKFLSIFGFGRQKGARATGFVTFSRTTASNYDIPIPRSTVITAPSVTTDASTITSLTYLTTEPVTIKANTTSILAPVQCSVVGSFGNVATGKISDFSGAPILGVTAVTNLAPTVGGINPESDEELKIRFKNTVFRNLSGTQDQFLALAVSTAFTTKANVVGPISRYREYLQIPDVNDASLDPDSGISGNGSASEFTAALSTIPYSKYIYDTIPYFVSNGPSALVELFFRPDTDFVLNNTTASKDKGDTYRGRINGSGANVITDASTIFQPNLTFLNVYTGTDPDVQGLRPKDIVLFEHSYMSTASRNDWTRNITNCVDVYINGTNATLADAVIAKPTGGTNLFTGVSSDRFYFDNFRRVGEPRHRPIQGNIFTALFFQPMLDLPDKLTVDSITYTKGVHYWAIEDVSSLRSTVRSRNGIEWSTGVNGKAGNDPEDGPYTGPKITASAATSISIDDYLFDKNIYDLQSALEINKQVTTDALGHGATIRHFKLDLTVMYNTAVSVADTNTEIFDNLAAFLDGQYFGTTIQLSDILQVIHNSLGVDNVRWSKEVLTAQGLTADSTGNARDRVVECDLNGNPLTNVIIERRVAGDGSTVEVWQMYLTGSPTGGSYKISWGGNTTAAIAYNASAATLQTALTGAPVSAPVTVTGSGTAASPFVLTFTGNGARTAFTKDPILLTGSTTIFNSDFFLKDDELPSLATTAGTSDTLPGLILRKRAQNTWNQL